MSELAKPQYKWLRASIVLGLLLGVASLGQTVLTYRYVSGNLVRQEALREAERKLVALGRSARLAGAHDPTLLTPILDELRHESPPQLAWVRILSPNGGVLAQSGQPTGVSHKFATLRRILADREHVSEVRETAAGKTLVMISPFWLGPSLSPRVTASAGQNLSRSFSRGVATFPAIGPATRPPPWPVAAEFAVYLDSVSVSFGRLRQNLIIGCSAAIALLTSMIVIGLRFEQYLLGKRYEQQLEVARRVQRDLLPAEDPLSDGLNFSAECIPAWHVGGDFYDAFVTKGDQTAFVLGDVSGKGLPAALLMGVIHGAVRSSDWTSSAASHEACSQRLNELLCAETTCERFASLFWCYHDQRTAVLRYVNAGHLPPLLIHGDDPGPVKVQRLTEGGPVLGMLPAATYRQGKVLTRPGDLLVIFSDGIIEATNAKGEEFGEDRLLLAIRENWDKSPGEVRDAILTQTRLFLGHRPLHDDQTFMVVRLHPVLPSRALSSAHKPGCAELSATSRSRNFEGGQVKCCKP